MKQKILIVGSRTIDKQIFADALLQALPDIRQARNFTSDLSYIDVVGNKLYYYTANEQIELDYRNNAIFSVYTTEQVSIGITHQELLRKDIAVINIRDFNTISDFSLNQYKPLIIWIDLHNSDTIENYRSDVSETKFLQDRIDNYEYLYFLSNEDPKNVAELVSRYVNSDAETKKQIRLENL